MARTFFTYLDASESEIDYDFLEDVVRAKGLYGTLSKWLFITGLKQGERYSHLHEREERQIPPRMWKMAVRAARDCMGTDIAPFPTVFESDALLLTHFNAWRTFGIEAIRGTAVEVRLFERYSSLSAVKGIQRARDYLLEKQYLAKLKAITRDNEQGRSARERIDFALADVILNSVYDDENSLRHLLREDAECAEEAIRLVRSDELPYIVSSRLAYDMCWCDTPGKHALVKDMALGRLGERWRVAGLMQLEHIRREEAEFVLLTILRDRLKGGGLRSDYDQAVKLGFPSALPLLKEMSEWSPEARAAYEKLSAKLSSAPGPEDGGE
jgi:hypothetical protein